MKTDSIQSTGQNNDLLTYNSGRRQRKELNTWFMTSSLPRSRGNWVCAYAINAVFINSVQVEDFFLLYFSPPAGKLNKHNQIIASESITSSVYLQSCHSNLHSRIYYSITWSIRREISLSQMYITGKPHPPKAVSNVNTEYIILEIHLFLVSFKSTWRLNLKSWCLFSIC